MTDPTPAPAPTRILLIRHGQSRWNVDRRVQGQTDVPLTPLGQAQAAALARRLASLPLAAVYSSPLRRARETAEAVARPHGLPVVTLAGLVEIDHGRWQGLTWAEVAARDSERYALWQRLPGRVVMPGGERLFDVRTRALEAVRGVVAAHPGATAALVSHEVVLRVLLGEALGMDYDHLGRLVLDNGGISVVEYGAGPPVVVTVNDTAHLAAVGSLEGRTDP